MGVRDGCQSVVNRGDGGERIFRTDDDRRRFPGRLFELPGIGMAEGAGPHGDWTRDAVVYAAVRLGGGTLSELLKRG